MRTKTVKRYYCDHCGKSGGSSFHIKRHEIGCTKNPNRVCGMCRSSGNSQRPLQDLVSACERDIADFKRRYPEFPFDYEAISPDELIAEANHCPACVLAGLRLCKNDMAVVLTFDFKSECARFWQKQNADREHMELHHG